MSPAESRSGLDRELKVLLALAVILAVSGSLVLSLTQSANSALLSVVATLAVIQSVLLAGGVTPIAIRRLTSSAAARACGSIALTAAASLGVLVALVTVALYWG